MEFYIFIIKRLFYAFFVLVGLSILIFVIARVVPGDPARMALGARAPKEVVQRLRQEMYLDKPLAKQYYYWARGVLSGNFGKSLLTYRYISDDIKEYLPATVELAIFATIITVIFAVILGTISAQYKNTWIDNLIRIISYFGVAIPSFVAAIFLMLLFGYLWPILPAAGRLSQGLIYPNRITGLLTVDSLLQGNFIVFWDALKHLILPSIALALAHICKEARITRSSIIENMNKDFFFAERSYGIPEKIIMFKYLLKLSLIPAASMMGLDFAASFARAFLVEMIFNWPGISRYAINSMMGKDLNVISAVVLVVGAVFIFANIMVDIIVSFLDPRRIIATNKGI